MKFRCLSPLKTNSRIFRGHVFWVAASHMRRSGKSATCECSKYRESIIPMDIFARRCAFGWWAGTRTRWFSRGLFASAQRSETFIPCQNRSYKHRRPTTLGNPAFFIGFPFLSAWVTNIMPVRALPIQTSGTSLHPGNEAFRPLELPTSCWYASFRSYTDLRFVCLNYQQSAGVFPRNCTSGISTLPSDTQTCGLSIRLSYQHCAGVFLST